ncbi:unnamed protein product [Caretta caretta]
MGKQFVDNIRHHQISPNIAEKPWRKYLKMMHKRKDFGGKQAGDDLFTVSEDIPNLFGDYDKEEAVAMSGLLVFLEQLPWEDQQVTYISILLLSDLWIEIFILEVRCNSLDIAEEKKPEEEKACTVLRELHFAE